MFVGVVVCLLVPQLFNHRFVCLLVSSFVCLFVCTGFCLLRSSSTNVHTYIYIFVYALVCWCLRSFVCLSAAVLLSSSVNVFVCWLFRGVCVLLSFFICSFVW